MSGLSWCFLLSISRHAQSHQEFDRQFAVELLNEGIADTLVLVRPLQRVGGSIRMQFHIPALFSRLDSGSGPLIRSSASSSDFPVRIDMSPTTRTRYHILWF